MYVECVLLLSICKDVMLKYMMKIGYLKGVIISVFQQYIILLVGSYGWRVTEPRKLGVLIANTVESLLVISNVILKTFQYNLAPRGLKLLSCTVLNMYNSFRIITLNIHTVSCLRYSFSNSLCPVKIRLSKTFSRKSVIRSCLPPITDNNPLWTAMNILVHIYSGSRCL